MAKVKATPASRPTSAAGESDGEKLRGFPGWGLRQAVEEERASLGDSMIRAGFHTSLGLRSDCLSFKGDVTWQQLV